MAPLRMLFLTLEFSAATFSGNGIYAQSQVRALSQLGHAVLVICARPQQHDPATSDPQGAVQLIQVPVSCWGRLDATAPYEELAQLGSTDVVAQAVAAFMPDVAMVVDWSALPLYRSLAAKLRPHSSLPLSSTSTQSTVTTNGLANGTAGHHAAELHNPPAADVGSLVLPMVYLNYRVFSRTATGADLALLSGLEREAMASAILRVALSRSDAEFLEQHVATQTHGACAEQRANGICGHSGSQADGAYGQGALSDGWGTAHAQVLGVKVLLPALREDMRLMTPHMHSTATCDGTTYGEPAGLANGTCAGTEAAAATAADAFARSRPYLTCCVRLSPEKEPQRFVELVEQLAARGALTPSDQCGPGVVPLLVGSASDEYAQGLKARLRVAAPYAVILEKFMGPADLADVYRRTRLNVHPATYDAYGMTIVEAASQGAPSLVHGGPASGSGDGSGAVGATDLLRGSADEVVLADFTAGAERLADMVQAILADPARLVRVATAAADKARSWSEAANAGTLVDMVRDALASRG